MWCISELNQILRPIFSFVTLETLASICQLTNVVTSIMQRLAQTSPFDWANSIIPYMMIKIAVTQGLLILCIMPRLTIYSHRIPPVLCVCVCLCVCVLMCKSP